MISLSELLIGFFASSAFILIAVGICVYSVERQGKKDSISHFPDRVIFNM
jgi:hypothetical protein